MNHLPWPHNDHLPLFEVPYICGDLPNLDRLDFHEYPLRRGWSTPENIFQWIDASPNITAQRAQHWLYFGLLQVFLGRRFDNQDFVTLSHGNWIINTRILPQRCLDLVRSIQDDQIVGKVGSSARRELRERWDNAFFEVKLHYEVLDRHLSVDTDEMLRLVASPIPILLQTLQRVAARVFWLDEDIPTIGDISLVPATLSIWQMLDEQWCKAQAGNFYRIYSPFLNHYLSGLPRRQLGRHEESCSWENCVGNNVNEESYETRHVKDACSCHFMGVDPTQLAKLVEDNRVPLVELRIVANQPQLRLVAADHGSKYFSLSHVWAGGLGNFKENKLPVCQLLKLHYMLENLDRFRPSGPRLALFDLGSHSADWFQSCLRALFQIVDFVIDTAERIRNLWNQGIESCGFWARLRKPRSLLFWMDTLCIPISPEHRALRLKAIGNMAFTYAAAERCLVLDPELQSISMKGLTSLQINAHVLCSTWLTRSWTFQEARLSRAWFAQFADGFYDPNSRANGALHHRLYSDWIIDKSDAHELASEMISWYHDMPAVRQTDMIANQSRRLLSDSTYTFITIWNQLVSRSTSKPEDVHGILANTLDLSAEEVLALPSQDKMKAILGAQEKLPAALIYNNATKIRDGNCRWIPLYPEETRISELYEALEPTGDGFILGSTRANPVGFLVDISVPRGPKVRLVHSSDSSPLWITFNQEPNGPPVSWEAPVDVLAICYVVGDLKGSSWSQSLVRRVAGARFALRRRDGNALHLVYEYTFFYSHHRVSGSDDDYLTVQAERTDTDAVFHVDCDLSSWPKLSYRRDTTSELSSHGIYFYTAFWITCIPFIWTPFYYFAVFTSARRPLLLPTIILMLRAVVGIFETIRLHKWVNEHAYKAWVKTFDESGSLKKRTGSSDEENFEIGTRVKIFRLQTQEPPMDLLSCTASVCALIAVVTKTVTYVIAVRNAPKELKDLIKKLREIRLDFESYLDLVKRAQDESELSPLSRLPNLSRLADPQNPSSPLAICLKEVETLNTSLAPVSSLEGSNTRAALQALKWPFKEKEMRKILDTFGELGDRLASARANDQA
ncbi:MAG: hypothetical protein Q9181_006956, partial [Wetmoreana brouardii]